MLDLLGLVLCGLGYRDSVALPLLPHLEVGGNWQFLTNCGVFATTIFIIADYLTSNFWLYHLISNIECCITFSYWTTRFLYPHTLNTDSFDVDLWLDLRIHLFPYLYLLFMKNKSTITLKQSLLVSSIGLGTYWIYISFLMYNNPGYVPYPFLANKTSLQRLPLLFKWIASSQFNYILQRLKWRR